MSPPIVVGIAFLVFGVTLAAAALVCLHEARIARRWEREAAQRN